MTADTWDLAAWVAAIRATTGVEWAAIALMIAPYAWGLRLVWRAAGIGRGVSLRQAACFAAAALLLVFAVASPLDAMSDALFSAHMVQHLLLVAVIPPLFVLSAPDVALAWALPSWSRRASHGAVGAVLRIATIPWIAWLVHTVALWTWHLPRFYDAALRNSTLHALEHAVFLVTAVALWWCALRPRGVRRSGFGIGVLLMLATAMQSGALGALLASTRHVWFPAQEAGAAAAGLNPLADQQLAGLIMWIPGGFIYTVAGCCLFLAWIRGRPTPAARESGELAMTT